MCQETARSALPWDHAGRYSGTLSRLLRGNALGGAGRSSLPALAAFCSAHLEQPHFIWHSLVVSSHPRHPPPREWSKSWLWTSRFLSALWYSTDQHLAGQSADKQCTKNPLPAHSFHGFAGLISNIFYSLWTMRKNQMGCLLVQLGTASQLLYLRASREKNSFSNNYM